MYFAEMSVTAITCDNLDAQPPAKIELIEIKMEFQDEENADHGKTQSGDSNKRLNNIRYWSLHKAEINRRRREQRKQERDDFLQNTSKADPRVSNLTRQQRYRERHKEELKRRRVERTRRLKNEAKAGGTSGKAENVGIFVYEDGFHRRLTIKQADKNTDLADSDAVKSDEIGPVEPLRVYLNQDEVVIKEENDYDPFDDIETRSEEEAGRYVDANISKLDSAINHDLVQTNQDFLNHVVRKLNGYDENKAALVKNIINKIIGDADAGLLHHNYDASASIQCKREI